VRVIDVTVPVRPGMPVYPGDPEVRLERVESIADGAAANLSRLDFGVHSGTHVDAPVHFIEGAPGAEMLPLDALVGPAVVVDGAGVQALDASDVAHVEPGAQRVLFKTSNSQLWARDDLVEEYVDLTEDGARALVALGVRLVGIDYVSIGGEATHQVLLHAGVVVVESLDLREVEPGRYTLVCAPLKLVGSDGAPARVLLLR
jgi:arylformamidase